MGRRPSAPGGRPVISNTRLSEVEQRMLDELRGVLDEAAYWRLLLHREYRRMVKERRDLNAIRPRRLREPEE